MTEMKLDIRGMTCENCVRHVTKAIGGVTGVQEAHVELTTETATIRHTASDEGKLRAEIAAAVKDAGYEVDDAARSESSPPNSAPPAVAPAYGSLALDIAGMHCESCIGRVEQALAKVSGVTSAQANLATNRATVHFQETTPSTADLLQAVERAGYHATLATQKKTAEIR